jgi:hypothetical protein
MFEQVREESRALWAFGPYAKDGAHVEMVLLLDIRQRGNHRRNVASQEVDEGDPRADVPRGALGEERDIHTQSFEEIEIEQGTSRTRVVRGEEGTSSFMWYP